MAIPYRLRPILGHIVSEPNRGHAEVGVTRRVRGKLSRDSGDRQRLAPMPVKWVPVAAGEGPLQRRERVVVGLHENLLQSQIVLHVPGEKHRVIDHYEILRGAPLLVRQHHVSFHSQHLDRHTAPVRNCIGLGLAGRVGKPNHCRVDPVVPKESLGKFVG